MLTFIKLFIKDFQILHLNMENMKPNIQENKNINDTDSIDINKEITEFLSFLKNNDNSKMMLKLSEIE